MHALQCIVCNYVLWIFREKVERKYLRYWSHLAIAPLSFTSSELSDIIWAAPAAEPTPDWTLSMGWKENKVRFHHAISPWIMSSKARWFLIPPKQHFYKTIPTPATSDSLLWYLFGLLATYLITWSQWFDNSVPIAWICTALASHNNLLVELELQSRVGCQGLFSGQSDSSNLSRHCWNSIRVGFCCLGLFPTDWNVS